MSLEILLEAAKFLESRGDSKARDDDYNEFAKYMGEPVGTSKHKEGKHKRDKHGHGGNGAFSTHKSSGGNSRNNTIFYHTTKLNSSASYSSAERSPEYIFGRNVSSIAEDPRVTRRIGGAGTREVHNKLEKNRRAHLKECFELLKKQLPSMEERKTSNLSILRGALRYIQILKRKEREFEHEMEKLAREKIASQQKLFALKKEVSSQMDHIDISSFLPDHDNETTTTASECGVLSDTEDVNGGHPSSQNQRSLSPDSASQSSSSSSVSSEDIPESNAAQQTPLSSVLKPLTTKDSVKVNQNFESLARAPKQIAIIPSGNKLRESISQVQLIRQPINGSISSAKTTQGPKSFQNNSNSQAQTTHFQLANSVSSASGGIQIGGVAGLLATPHTVQVINQGGSGVKVYAASSTLGGGSSTLISTQNGPLIFSPSPSPSSLVAMATNGPSKTVASKGQIRGPLFINQNVALPTHRVAQGKLGTQTVTVKSQHPLGAIGSFTTQANGISYMQPRMASHILQAVSQKALSQGLVNATVGQIPSSGLGRQLLTAAIKPVGSTTQICSSLSQLTRVTQVTQLVSQASVGQLVATGPPVSIMSTGSFAQHKFDKVLVGPQILKSVGPLIQKPSLGPNQTTAVVKPLVMVSMANKSTPPGPLSSATTLTK